MINSLKGLTKINGKKIMTNDQRPKKANGHVDWDKFDKMREEFPICIDHEKDMISFKMLTKPASEGGDLRNAQLTELIGAGLEILKYLHNKFPCKENENSIHHLNYALTWQERRTNNRVARGVEGQDKL